MITPGDVDDRKPLEYKAFVEFIYGKLVADKGYIGKNLFQRLSVDGIHITKLKSNILRRIVEYLHKVWPRTIIELRGDSHFCSHEFMDWSHGKYYVRFTTGLSGNVALMKMIDRQLRRAKGDYERHGEPVRRYYSIDYKAKNWRHRQRIAMKIEVSSMGSNVRFVVTSNRNNKPETIYRHYCRRGTMELWIKDLKYFRADRMSCNSFRANMFRLFLYGAAYVMAHKLKTETFKDTDVEAFTMDSLIKRIMLSSVFIRERKTFISFSFSQSHRHREAIALALERLAA